MDVVHAETHAPAFTLRREPGPAADARPVLLVAAAASDAQNYGLAPFTRVVAHSTADAVSLLREHPDVVAIEWDLPDLDGEEICRCARAADGTRVLVATAEPDQAPRALRAGCHAVLLKPFSVSLLAERLGRLCRETPRRSHADGNGCGTNRVWPEVTCPRCGTLGATGFDHASYRRNWYACLACDLVWLGRRRE